MNTEVYNAENRTTGVIVPTNRINRLRHTARCCSFCRQNGHNITTCNDSRLTLFEELCKSQKTLFELEENPIEKFTDWAFEYYLSDSLLVKSFAIRKCGSTTRTPLINLIDTVVNYIYNIDTYSNANEDFIPLSQELQFHRFITGAAGLLLLQQNNNGEINNPNNSEIISRLEVIISNFILYGNLGNNIKYDVDLTNRSTSLCDCSICYESVEHINFVKFNCKHEFCKDCAKHILTNCEQYKTPTCALCRAEIKEITSKTEEVKEYISNIIM
uniref:RING-type domain-containing protein n=1 Tax=viral metagenome TaxID=1070528 RepID=A0A6C0EQC9_9ZZZZ